MTRKPTDVVDCTMSFGATRPRRAFIGMPAFARVTQDSFTGTGDAGRQKINARSGREPADASTTAIVPEGAHSKFGQ